MSKRLIFRSLGARRLGPSHLLRRADGLVDGLGEVLDVMRVQACHGDAAVLRHVDMRVLTQLQDLLFGQAGEAEHADLVCDVVPCAGCAELLELAAEGAAHLLDAARHLAEVGLPLLEELGVVQDGRGDAGTVCRRIRDL